ncbi:MAG: hypothetical protein V1679_02240 [Candidatus Peregrinibacteria bacterium]
MKIKSFLLVVIFLALSGTVFAEGDAVCVGKISGTSSGADSNAGRMHFDAHPGKEANQPASLAVGGVDALGLAPGSRSYAACAEEKGAGSYQLEGWVWNDNLGFISMFCEGGKNPPSVMYEDGVAKNPVPCGGFNYKVVIGSEVAGKRVLSGYAWNEVFGYLWFPTKAEWTGWGLPGNPVFNGVQMDTVTGDLTGYAWTEAKVWINFSGVKIDLLGEPEAATGFCGDLPKPYLCVEIDPFPGEETRLANGIDGYQINLYFKQADGVTPIRFEDSEITSITFNWDDTVKINQLTGQEVSSSLGETESPFGAGLGGVFYKPLALDAGNFGTIFQEVALGHYELSPEKIIKSYAPTTNGNISYTTSTKPPVPFNNEFFVVDLEDESGPWTKDIESNNLILESVGFVIGAGPQRVVYPSGKNGVSLEFVPPVRLDTLYANDLQDAIVGFRNIPTNFTLKVVKEDTNFSYSEMLVQFFLDYAKAATERACEGASEGMRQFVFKFMENAEYGAATEGVFTFNESKFNQEINLSGVSGIPAYDGLSDDEKEKEGTVPCPNMEGPSFYSEISYMIGGKVVSYYGNKLPRVASSVVNPSAVIHGNIYAPKAFSPTVSHKTQPTGNVAVDVVRNTVNENIRDYVGEGSVTDGEGQSCTISSLKQGAGPVTGCTSNYYKKFEVGDEHVLYFEGSDVHLDVGGVNWEGKWVLILDGGNLYVDKDLYYEGTGTKPGLAAVVLRPFGEGCENSNIYIHSSVKNIQMNAATDCSVFSYAVDVDEDTGFPVWGGFAEMIEALGNQLLWEGSIASRNTIGGADLDVQGEEYLLLGTGERFLWRI